MGAVLSTEEPARSVTEVEGLLTKHNEYRAEMHAREESVAMVTKVGRKLIQQGHYASTEVSAKYPHTLATPTHYSVHVTSPYRYGTGSQT